MSKANRTAKSKDPYLHACVLSSMGIQPDAIFPMRTLGSPPRLRARI